MISRRLYGHLAWRDRGSASIVGGKTLCGKVAKAPLAKQPLVVCPRCVTLMLLEPNSSGLIYRAWEPSLTQWEPKGGAR